MPRETASVDCTTTVPYNAPESVIVEHRASITSPPSKEKLDFTVYFYRGTSGYSSSGTAQPTAINRNCRETTKKNLLPRSYKQAEKEFRKLLCWLVLVQTNDWKKEFKVNTKVIMYRCLWCGNVLYQKDAPVTFLKFVRPICPSCVNKIGVCEVCERVVNKEESTVVPSAHRRDIWHNPEILEVPKALCSDCRDHYYICIRCNRITEMEHSTISMLHSGLCPFCFDEATKVCHNHGYTPHNIVFYPEKDTSSLYLGVELETDLYPSVTHTRHTMRVLKERSNMDRLFWMQHDGSLTQGFELNTHPMTLNYHRKEFPWKEVLKVITENGGCGDRSLTAGLHIHFNKDFLGNQTEADINSLKAIVLFERCWTRLAQFSRRERHSLNKWAGRYGRRINKSEIRDLEPLRKIHYIKSNIPSRYFAVNVLNLDTVEIRLFRSTTRLDVLMATLELTDYVARLAKSIDMSDVQKITWAKLTKNISDKDYPCLDEYIKKNIGKGGR